MALHSIINKRLLAFALRATRKGLQMEKNSSQREQILIAARRLFSKNGYHGTTIRQIADARGILSGSLYTHITSKEDLLFEIAEEGANAFVQAIGHVTHSSLDSAEKLRAGLAAHIRVISNHLDAAKVFFHEWQALTGQRRAVIQAKRDAYEAAWQAILDEGVANGTFQLRDPKFARLLVLSVGNWVYHWYQPEGGLSPEAIADRFGDVILFGLMDSKERGEDV